MQDISEFEETEKSGSDPDDGWERIQVYGENRGRSSCFVRGAVTSAFSSYQNALDKLRRYDLLLSLWRNIIVPIGRKQIWIL